VAEAAAAGSPELYNRYQLFAKAPQAKLHSHHDQTDIQHYVLEFVGHKSVFWIIEPTLDDGKWNGCVMRTLLGAGYTDECGVKELVNWVNEIHRRGLSVRGPSCERGIKAVFHIGGVRTSVID
jgi:hypothetical protein